jgi:hypothetical protein
MILPVDLSFKMIFLEPPGKTSSLIK